MVNKYKVNSSHYIKTLATQIMCDNNIGQKMITWKSM